ncbi:trypsin-like cysteine/serine peptidase domain-containing protein [Coniochaeta sp. 2T2.1]|nr:trypsin-like cysteine/serine peptidase domain-containing protein [Coniochaeta sp. 2T2.1]
MLIIIHTADPTLPNIPFDTDENRTVLANAPASKKQVASEIQEKKNSLVKTYPDVYGVVDGLAELDKLPWPNTRDAKFAELIKQFKTLKCAAMGTGFHVSDNLVVTAAHCVEDLGPFNLGEYRLVFNFTGDDVAAANVFSIRRLVDMAAMVEGAETYDVAVLEMIGASNAQPQPKALVLQPTLAVKGTDVYSIGCSSGMPFIYADGSKGKKADPLAGTVRKLPDAGKALARQGSITADIDVSKGNSGGPLFNAKTDEVLGICRSGMIYPWLGDMGGPDVANDTLKDEIRKWIKTKFVPVGDVFEPNFLDFYLQLRMLKDNTRVSWIRFKGGSAAIDKVNAFSRTDPYAYLTMPLKSFLDNIKGHLSIVVEIYDNAWNPFAVPPPLQGDIALVITSVPVASNTNTHQGSTLTLPGGRWNGDSSEVLKWSFATNNAPIQSNFIGTLNNTLSHGRAASAAGSRSASRASPTPAAVSRPGSWSP